MTVRPTASPPTFSSGGQLASVEEPSSVQVKCTVTGPMYQLFIFFMITDPRTTVKPRWAQCVVAAVVAVRYTMQVPAAPVASERTFRCAVAFESMPTLEERIQKRGPLPPADAIRIATDALRGLQHLHEKGMIHRDLKPANIMLVAPLGAVGVAATQETVKLLDIGLGRGLFDEAAPGGGDEPAPA